MDYTDEELNSVFGPPPKTILGKQNKRSSSARSRKLIRKSPDLSGRKSPLLHMPDDVVIDEYDENYDIEWKNKVRNEFNNDETLGNYEDINWKYVYKKLFAHNGSWQSLLIKPSREAEVLLALDQGANSADTVRVIKHKNGRVQEIGMNILTLSAMLGYEEAVGLILQDSRFDVGKLGYNALLKAVKHAHESIIILLLDDNRLNVTHRSHELLIMGTRKTSFFALMNHRKIDPAVNRNETIIALSKKGKYKAVEILLNDSRVDPTDQNNAAIRVSYKRYINLQKESEEQNKNNKLDKLKHVIKSLLQDTRVESKLSDDEYFLYYNL